MAWTAPSTWVAGAILTAAQLNTQLRDNLLAGGPIYATTAARDSAIPSPFAGQRAFISGTNVNYQYNGTAWVSAQALSIPPMCRAYLSTSTNISNNTVTSVSFDSENYDTDTMHSTSSNTNRITFTTAGVYALSAACKWATAAGGVRQIVFRLNGTTDLSVASQASNGGGNNTDQQLSVQYSFAANDYVELRVYQDSGGTVAIRGDVTNGVWVAAALLGKIS
jgi:hypothetical protein